MTPRASPPLDNPQDRGHGEDDHANGDPRKRDPGQEADPFHVQNSVCVGGEWRALDSAAGCRPGEATKPV